MNALYILSRPCETKSLSLEFPAPASAVPRAGPREVGHVDHFVPEDVVWPDAAPDLSWGAHTLTQAGTWPGVSGAVIIQAVHAAEKHLENDNH